MNSPVPPLPWTLPASARSMAAHLAVAAILAAVELDAGCASNADREPSTGDAMVDPPRQRRNFGPEAHAELTDDYRGLCIASQVIPEGPGAGETNVTPTGCAQGSQDASPGPICTPATTPYPVDPQVHVVDPANDARQPGSVRATIPNSTAYAAYAAALLGGGRPSAEPTVIAAVVTARAHASGVGPARALGLFQRGATDAERTAHAQRVAVGARGFDAAAPLATLAMRVVDIEGQVAACAGEGTPRRACCEALAVPWFFSDPWAKLDEAGRAALTSNAASLYDALPTGAIAHAQPFEHQGIKAWLSTCGPAIDGLPESLADVKGAWSDWTRGGAWDVELHPISMAKQAARRIYRRRDAAVSIAESLDEDCSVRETELVVARADGLAVFATYGPEGARITHGLFPARAGVDAVKYTPDSCMGCHFRLDSRAFDVRMPSYIALGLGLRRSGGAPLWVDGSGCARPDERQIWHERPPADP